jgi:hypothetical protein
VGVAREGFGESRRENPGIYRTINKRKQERKREV